MSETLYTLTALVGSTREAQKENSIKIHPAIQTRAQEMHQAHSSIEQLSMLQLILGKRIIPIGDFGMPSFRPKGKNK